MTNRVPILLSKRPYSKVVDDIVSIKGEQVKAVVDEVKPPKEHAVISTFDLFSIGVGPSR